MKYRASFSQVLRDGVHFGFTEGKAYADMFAAELNTLLARAEAAEKRAEQAEREQHETRELLAKVNWIGFREKAYRELRIEDGLAFDCAAAALSRCTPPAGNHTTKENH